jgi:alcohol dehydrogenase class IV
MVSESTLKYELLCPSQIVFGWGRRGELGRLAAEIGQRALLVQGGSSLSRSGFRDDILKNCRDASIEVVPIANALREPTIADVDAAAKRMHEFNPDERDFILAVGGGSALDLGKALAAMATQPRGESIRHYLEGAETRLPLRYRPLPIVALPTTAGTGTEATRNAVISVSDPPVKRSLRSKWIMPKLAIVDPELSSTTPPNTTATSGFDAITQLIESYISRRSQPVPRALALQGLALALPALPRAFVDGSDREAREAMSHAALLSGICLANSGLGLAHGVAAALGAQCGVPHGLACAVMLPVAIRVNRSVCEPQLAALARASVARSFASDLTAVDALIAAVERLQHELHIPIRLSELGITPDRIPGIVAGSRGNSMSGNPRDLTDQELTDVLRAMA